MATGAIAFRFSSRLGFNRLIAVGAIVAGCGFLCISRASSIPPMLLGLVLNGLGSGLLIPTLLAMTMEQLSFELRGRGGGSIINFASANAHHALKGSPALAHVAAKGAVLAMTHQLAMEGAPHGIRANSISPGSIVSAATRPVLADHERAEQLRLTHMIQRFGQPADIAWAALYLASDESAWVTASEIRVDGGTTHW